MSLSVLLTIGAMSCAQMQEEYHDFRKAATDARFTLMGPNAATVTRPDDGLRVTLPADRKDRSPVGVGAEMRLGGDFEITASFEFINVEKPPASFGSGVSLFVLFDEAKYSAASVARFHDKRGEQIFSGDRVLGERSMPRTKDKHTSAAKPATAMTGRLQLKRTGDVVHCLAADGFDDPPAAFHTVAVGHDAVSLVRLSAGTGYTAAAADVRLLDLRIRAESIDGVGEPKKEAAATIAKEAPAPETSPGFRRWLLLVAATFAALLIGVAFVLLRRRTARSEKTQLPPSSTPRAKAPPRR